MSDQIFPEQPISPLSSDESNSEGSASAPTIPLPIRLPEAVEEHESEDDVSSVGSEHIADDDDSEDEGAPRNLFAPFDESDSDSEDLDFFRAMINHLHAETSAGGGGNVLANRVDHSTDEIDSDEDLPEIEDPARNVPPPNALEAGVGQSGNPAANQLDQAQNEPKTEEDQPANQAPIRDEPMSKRFRQD